MTWKLIWNPDVPGELLGSGGSLKGYDDAVHATTPEECCCLLGNTCEECFEGATWYLCATLTGNTTCEAWNDSFCFVFNFSDEVNCEANGFTITDECGTSLAGMNAEWNGTTLCIRIADINGKIHEWCGTMTCADIMAGVELPEVFGSGGGTMHVQFSGFSGCVGCG